MPRREGWVARNVRVAVVVDCGSSGVGAEGLRRLGSRPKEGRSSMEAVGRRLRQRDTLLGDASRSKRGSSAVSG